VRQSDIRFRSIQAYLRTNYMDVVIPPGQSKWFTAIRIDAVAL
jgi:hypothetical protein